MKRLRGLVFAVVAVLALTLCAVAQSTSASQEQPADQSVYPAASEQNAAQHTIPAPDDYSNEQSSAPGPAAAPVLGHPLDPADVDTLTGKNDQRRQPGAPAGAYYTYPMSNNWFGTPQFGTRFFSGPSTYLWSPVFSGGFGPGGFGAFGPGGFGGFAQGGFGNFGPGGLGNFGPGGFGNVGPGGFGNFGPSPYLFSPGSGTSFFLGGPHFSTPRVMFTPGQSANYRTPPRSGNSTGSRFGPHHRP